MKVESMKRVATVLRMSPKLGFGYSHARVLLDKKKENGKKEYCSQSRENPLVQ